MENNQKQPKEALNVDTIFGQPITYLAFVAFVSSQLRITMENAADLIPSGYATNGLILSDAIAMVNQIREETKDINPFPEGESITSLKTIPYDALLTTLLDFPDFKMLVAKMTTLSYAEISPYIGSIRATYLTVDTAIQEANRICAMHPDMTLPEPQSDVSIDFQKNYISRKAQLSVLARWVDGKIASGSMEVYQSKLTPGTVHSVANSETDLLKFLERLKGIVHEKFYSEGAESVREGLKKGIENFVNSL